MFVYLFDKLSADFCNMTPRQQQRSTIKRACTMKPIVTGLSASARQVVLECFLFKEDLTAVQQLHHRCATCLVAMPRLRILHCEQPLLTTCTSSICSISREIHLRIDALHQCSSINSKPVCRARIAIYLFEYWKNKCDDNGTFVTT